METPQQAIDRLHLSLAAVEKVMAKYRKRYNKDMSKANARRKAQYANMEQEAKFFSALIERNKRLAQIN